jgi:beta-mannosidase
LDLPIIEHYFGPATSLEEIVERGQLLQAEGYKGLYEEARRQKPVASMALCWCLNEPWPTAANNSLISWPSRPKPALAAVAAACRPMLASARIRKFQWNEGELFDPELWWLNDSAASCDPGVINAHLESADGQRWPLLSWHAGLVQTNQNVRGPKIQWRLRGLHTERFTLVLETPQFPAASSRYILVFRGRTEDRTAPAIMNLG